MASITPNVKTLFRRQRTIGKEVSFSGIGVHTGAGVAMRFRPASEGTGLVFKRTDLPSQPLIPATLEYVCDTNRSTTIGIGDVHIHTVEHVLAAFAAFRIDNVCIELSSIEPPVANGDSEAFVDMIEEAGIVEQQATTPIVQLEHPVYWSQGDIHFVALPCNEYRISYTLSYPESKVLGSQFHSVIVDGDHFKNEIACCRTFTLYEDVSFLMDKGLIKGGSLDNAVVIKDDVVFSKGGLRFSNEMVRHKILDVIGDLSLLGFDFLAHLIAIRSGHASNFAFAKELFHSVMKETC